MFYECDKHGWLNLSQLTRAHFRAEHKYPPPEPGEQQRATEAAHMMLTFSDGVTIRTEDRKLMNAVQEYIAKGKVKE